MYFPVMSEDMASWKYIALPLPVVALLLINFPLIREL